MRMSHKAGILFEESLASLFQPDPLLPVQYFQTLQNKALLEPERRLMAAVLEDAILCYRRYMAARDTKKKNIFREAEDWIFDNKSDWFFSFDSVCEVLDLNPESVRQELLRWKKRKLGRIWKAKIHGRDPSPSRWIRKGHPMVCRRTGHPSYRGTGRTDIGHGEKGGDHNGRTRP